MKKAYSILLAPLVRHIGALAASGTAGAAIVDPAIGTRVESWVMAGILLAADLIAAGLRSKKMEAE